MTKLSLGKRMSSCVTNSSRRACETFFLRIMGISLVSGKVYFTKLTSAEMECSFSKGRSSTVMRPLAASLLLNSKSGSKFPQGVI